LWVSVTNAVGGRFKSPESSLSASFTFLQSLDRQTLAASPQRGSTSHELSRPSAHPDRRVHYDGLCLPTGSAFRVWLPSGRLSPRRTLPTLFQIGSAHGFHPLERSPRNRRLGIPAALTHMPLAVVAAICPKTHGHVQRLSFWASFLPRVPRGWTGPLGPAAAGGSFGVRPSRGLRPPGSSRPSPQLLLRT